MPTVLVIEGNTPDVSAKTREAGGTPAAEQYAAVLTEIGRGLGESLDTRIARPSWPDFRLDAMEFGDLAGVAITGSGVAWSSDAAEASADRALLEAVFAAGLPVVGSCWGLQLGAVVLGGTVRASPSGYEQSIARHVRLTKTGHSHPFHAGRRPSFDAACVHRDEVHHLPHGAQITASNDHSEVQAMVYDRGGVSFWGVQYHPELSIDDTLIYRLRQGPDAPVPAETFGTRTVFEQMCKDFEAVTACPDEHPDIAWRYGLSSDLLDPSRRKTELRNWLAHRVFAHTATEIV